MYVYQQIIFDINIYTQKRSKFRSLYKSVPTVWRRGNKRCREPLSRWRGVHLEQSFYGGLSRYFLKAKLLSCTLKSPWMLISFQPTWYVSLMGCDWSESSGASFLFEWQTIQVDRPCSGFDGWTVDDLWGVQTKLCYSC